MGLGGTHHWAAVAALAVAAAWSFALCVNDIRSQRLPNPLTVPPAFAAILGAVLWPACAWGLVWPVIYLLTGRGIGGGDVKLAAPLGVVCAAAVGPVAVCAAIGISGLITGAIGLATRRARLAHGPSMLAAAWCVAAAGVTCTGGPPGV